MATLNIRNLPEAVHQALRLRAARSGRSMEAEARSILAQACLPAPTSALADVQDWVDQFYGERKPANVSDELIQERRREATREP